MLHDFELHVFFLSPKNVHLKALLQVAYSFSFVTIFFIFCVVVVSVAQIILSQENILKNILVDEN